jgi:hypothetical protein
MQGKTRFKTPPDSAALAELKRLTGEAVKQWAEKQWL